MNLSFTPKVLLINDSKWELELFRSMLEEQYEVIKEFNAVHALECATLEKPHIIVLDMIMPGIEGIDVLIQLKNNQYTKHIPVIMLTAYSNNEEKVVKCIELGACDYLFKPISEKLFVAKISRAIKIQYFEDSLRKSLAYNNHLMEAISSIIIGVSATGSISYWNSEAQRCFGFKADDVVGEKMSEIDINWNWECLKNNINISLKNQSYRKRFDVNYQSNNSGSRVLSVCVAPFVRAEDDSEYLIIADDITEIKIQQSYDHQNERLQSIGQLASGIAHEINTPIQYVGDNTYFLQESFQELIDVVDGSRELVDTLVSSKEHDKFKIALHKLYEDCDYNYLLDNVPKAIEQSLEGIERVTTIVKAMKDFSHPGSEQKVLTDINRAIESTVTVARNVWKYVADLETNFDPNMGEFPCFSGPFNEVILNIIVNAAHAIGDSSSVDEKGAINISTKRLEKFGEIRISDSGSGIPMYLQSKIFDPFFTTKEVGKGTGQGLSLCRNIIVEQHNGEIFFETTEGEGTTFVIHLPVAGLGCEETIENI